jgi:monoamine oxidase
VVKSEFQMRTHRHKGASPAPVNAGTDTNRRINALVFLLEEKGILARGELEDAVMNLKVQLGDLPPQAGGRPRPTQNSQGSRRGPGGDYIGPERRRQLESEREEGQERRDSVRTAVAHISGDVVNEEDRHPISGVQLILRRSSLNNPPIQFRSTKTDMQGRFVFLNLPLTKEGESDQAYTYALEVRYRNRTIYSTAAVDLKPAQTTHHQVTASLVEA